MERTYINEAQKAIGGTVKVQGFIENLRNSKYMAFIVLKDITGADAGEITPETELFEEGLLDSFGLVELLVRLEQFGKTLDVAELPREEFSTPA